MIRARWRRWLLLAPVTLSVFLLIVSVLLGEWAARRWPREIPNDPERISVNAKDGVQLVATYSPASKPLHRCVIVQHGHASYRGGMPGLRRDYLAAGYHVLLPDNRGHGESGGIATYGVLEREDLKKWVDWLEKQDCQSGIFAHGMSMGAAEVLQLAAIEPRVKAVVADSPFSSFESIGSDRIRQMVPLLAWCRYPIAQVSRLYVRLRYGVDLVDANPMAMAPLVRQPVLLIHGSLDTNVDPKHSAALLPLYQHAERWYVDGCKHVACYGMNPSVYMQKTLGWFESALNQ